MSPYFLLSVLIGGLYGAAFHTWQGKKAADLLYYFPVGVVGFGLGQVTANLIGWQFWLIGPLHIFEATLVSWAILALARWLKG